MNQKIHPLAIVALESLQSADSIDGVARSLGGNAEYYIEIAQDVLAWLETTGLVIGCSLTQTGERLMLEPIPRLTVGEYSYFERVLRPVMLVLSLDSTASDRDVQRLTGSNDVKRVATAMRSAGWLSADNQIQWNAVVPSDVDRPKPRQKPLREPEDLAEGRLISLATTTELPTELDLVRLIQAIDDNPYISYRQLAAVTGMQIPLVAKTLYALRVIRVVRVGTGAMSINHAVLFDLRAIAEEIDEVRDASVAADRPELLTFVTPQY